MLQGIHHLNFLVADLDAAVARWRALFDLGGEVRESLPERGVDTARFRIGDTWLVLVTPTDPDGLPARHLRRHGEGPFLLSFAVADLDAARSRVDAAAGVAVCGRERAGVDGWRVADIDTELGADVVIQLTEEPGA